MASGAQWVLLAAAIALGLAATRLAAPELGLSTAAEAFLWLVVLALGALLAAVISRRRNQERSAAAAATEVLHTLGAEVPGDALGAVSRSLSLLESRLAEAESRLRESRAARESEEAALRESEERYAVAVRGADDGMWEWDLRTGRMQFSARWKALLGYSEDELPDRPAEWYERIHPNDRERVVSAMKQHAGGLTERFESEHRLQHRDGRYRWVLARGAAVQAPDGKPCRVVGLVTDITVRRQVQESLIELADSLAALRGEECLRELTRRFADVLGVREVFVTECCDYEPTTRLRMLARWDAGNFARCVEFEMAGTSCEEVILGGKTLYVADHLGDRWPREREYRRASYLGLPCHDATGRVIGNIACADEVPMRQELPHLSVLKIFAIRVAVELERRQLERIGLSATGGAAPVTVTPGS